MFPLLFVSPAPVRLAEPDTIIPSNESSEFCAIREYAFTWNNFGVSTGYKFISNSYLSLILVSHDCRTSFPIF